MVNNPSEVGLAIAKARRLRTFVVGLSRSTPTKNDSHHLIETSGHLCLYHYELDVYMCFVLHHAIFTEVLAMYFCKSFSECIELVK